MNEYIKRVGKFILVCEKSNVERSKQMELLRNDFFYFICSWKKGEAFFKSLGAVFIGSSLPFGLVSSRCLVDV